MSPQKPPTDYYSYEETPDGDQVQNGVDENSESTQGEESNEIEDFSEYLWMENEEEFDKQVLQQLEEEELMEQCIQAMLEEERNTLINNIQNSESSENQNIMDVVNAFKLIDVEKSTLNPLAAEFIPREKFIVRVSSTNGE